MSGSAGGLRGRTVFLTGHTGFKGSWLCHWLKRMDCKVHGFALDPSTEPSMFEVSRVAGLLASDTRADLRDEAAVADAMRAAAPHVVFHLAAQPLVREGYRDPIGTFSANVMGTAHVLNAVRGVPSVRAVVVITTDKVYENREWLHPYREIDPLGGHDPYSASKAAAEITTASFRSSYFAAPDAPRIATARAGNVIGGGDWAKDRLLPDCLAAFAANRPVGLRYPHAIRPWQHVLEPLAGYVALAEKLLDTGASGFDRAWNFGPDTEGDAEVGDVARTAAEIWGSPARVDVEEDANAPHEAGILRLDSTLARVSLGWAPRWNLRSAIEHSIAWHKSWLGADDMSAVTQGQIADYIAGQPQ